METEKILEKARELGMMIAQSDEFANMKKAEEIQLADPKAQELFKHYNERRDELSAQAASPDITKEEFDKIQMDAQAEFIKLCANENIKNYFDANQAYSNLINQVNGIIAHFVNGEEETGCSGSCSSCRGCH